jgi:hypothetical protein
MEHREKVEDFFSRDVFWPSKILDKLLIDTDHVWYLYLILEQDILIWEIFNS